MGHTSQPTPSSMRLREQADNGTPAFTTTPP